MLDLVEGLPPGTFGSELYQTFRCPDCYQPNTVVLWGEDIRTGCQCRWCPEWISSEEIYRAVLRIHRMRVKLGIE